MDPRTTCTRRISHRSRIEIPRRAKACSSISRETRSGHGNAYFTGLGNNKRIVFFDTLIESLEANELEAVLARGEFRVEAIPREALFLAGKAFAKYRKRKGAKRGVLPDFFIGAHAAVQGLKLLTRDKGRYASYFPTVELISPPDR